jgi:WD40 repeat protein
MAFVPGDKYLATTGGGLLSVWDLETGRLVRTLGTDDPPREGGFGRLFAFTPDGKRLLSTDQLTEIAAGDRPDRKPRLLLREFSSGKLLRVAGVNGVPLCLAIRPDGRAAACADQSGDVFFCDLEKNAVRRLVEGDWFTAVHRLSFAGDGKHLVVLPSEGGVSRRIDVASGELLKQIELGKCDRVALASGNGTIATYSHPDRLYLYDTATGEKQRFPLKEEVHSLDLTFSPDGGTLVAADRESEMVQFWDVAKGRLLRRLRVPGLARTSQQAELLLSGDGERLASYEEENVVRIWDARTGQPRQSLPSHVRPPVQLAFSADGKEAVSYARQGRSVSGELCRWDLATGKLLRSISPEAPKEDWPAWNTDWRLAPGGLHLAERDEPVTYLYEGRTGKRLALPEESPPKSDWTFTPDGRALVTTDQDRGVRLWDVATGKLLRRLQLEKKGGPFSWIRLTPDGRTVATGEQWRKVHLWDAMTGKHRATLTASPEREPLQTPLGKWQIDFTPDGRYLFASNTLSLWVWDLVARQEIGTFEETRLLGNYYGLSPVAASPDGRLVAWKVAWHLDQHANVRSAELRLYEVCTGKIVHRIPGNYSSIAFAPSGCRLATGCEADSSALVWDVPLLFRSQPFPAKDTSPEALWDILKTNDAVLAQRALWRLASLPEAEAFLARHLQPVESIPPERLRALVADLGSPAFATREKAVQTLAAAGESVRSALAGAVAESKDPEVQRRLAGLRERLERPDPLAPERLREVRAVTALESRGTAESRRLLQRLAAGQAEARLTQWAKEALGRLSR